MPTILNPKAVEFLRENARLNKCSQLQISEPSCARSFLRSITAWRPTHCIYNLPATGIELPDVFRDFTGEAPIVHCYCFGKSRNDADAMSDVHARCQNAVGASLPTPDKLLPSPAARRRYSRRPASPCAGCATCLPTRTCTARRSARRRRGSGRGRSKDSRRPESEWATSRAVSHPADGRPPSCFA